MTDVIDPCPDGEAEQVGWVVTDPYGRVIASGPITHAQAAAWAGENTDSEGARE